MLNQKQKKKKSLLLKNCLSAEVEPFQGLWLNQPFLATRKRLSYLMLWLSAAQFCQEIPHCNRKQRRTPAPRLSVHWNKNEQERQDGFGGSMDSLIKVPRVIYAGTVHGVEKGGSPLASDCSTLSSHHNISYFAHSVPSPSCQFVRCPTSRSRKSFWRNSTYYLSGGWWYYN